MRSFVLCLLTWAVLVDRAVALLHLGAMDGNSIDEAGDAFDEDSEAVPSIHLGPDVASVKPDLKALKPGSKSAAVLSRLGDRLEEKVNHEDSGNGEVVSSPIRLKSAEDLEGGTTWERALGFEWQQWIIEMSKVRRSGLVMICFTGPVILSVMLIVISRTLADNTTKKKQADSISFFILLLITVLWAAGAGYSSGSDDFNKAKFRWTTGWTDLKVIMGMWRMWATGACVCGMICSAAFTCRCAGVDFGWPEFPNGLKCFGFAVGMLHASALIFFWLAHYYLRVSDDVYYATDKASTMKALSQACTYGTSISIAVGMTSLRGYSILPLMISMKCVETFYFANWGAAEARVYHELHFFYPAWAAGCLFFTASLYTKYLRDQQIVAFMGVLVLQAVRLGSFVNAWDSFLKRHTQKAPLFICFFYVCLLFVRFWRSLPPALRQCGYVRLGYLRKMYREGMTIQRYQDMPDYAYGEPAKALNLIIISHRWLDRFFCDMATTEWPRGFRLNTLASRLEEHYPVQLCCNLCAMLASITVCGCDVLIFFDFMCLPQIGRDQQGIELPRTPEEQKIFEAALPEMGALYTMYPVLVIPEVTGGVHAYTESGWCFCEYEQALLCDRLRHFSATFVEEHDAEAKKAQRSMTAVAFDESAAASFLNDFEVDLASKRFYFDSDRDTVRGIVMGKMIHRQLHDAVISQDPKRVKEYLDKLTAKGLTHQINHAVDELLDTILHVAMRGPSKDIVDLILTTEGVDKHARNIRGDRATQWFMMPVAVRNLLTCQCCRTKS